jgi:hypothetical protein
MFSYSQIKEYLGVIYSLAIGKEERYTSIFFHQTGKKKGSVLVHTSFKIYFRRN